MELSTERQKFQTFLNSKRVETYPRLCQTKKPDVMKTDNELIAEFMGGKHAEDIGNPYRYDVFWDALIPVCKRWDELYLTDPILKDRGTQKYTQYIIGCDKLDDAITKGYDINDVYPVIVGNIKWYNGIQEG